MVAFLGLVCLAVLSTASAQFVHKVMDSQVAPVQDADCSKTCKALMDGGLSVINVGFATLIKELPVDSGFCKGKVTGLSNFKATHKCATNKDGDIHDHTIHLEFKSPVATFNCSLPNSPAAAAKKINDGFLPSGKCGKDGINDKIVRTDLKCDGDASGDQKDMPVIVDADLKGMVLDLVLRIDSRSGRQDAYPLSFTMTLPKKNPASLKKGDGFEDAWKCISNDENIAPLLRKMFFNAFRPIFGCLDDKETERKSFIETTLYVAGSCGGKKQ